MEIRQRIDKQSVENCAGTISGWICSTQGNNSCTVGLKRENRSWLRRNAIPDIVLTTVRCEFNNWVWTYSICRGCDWQVKIRNNPHRDHPHRCALKVVIHHYLVCGGVGRCNVYGSCCAVLWVIPKEKTTSARGQRNGIAATNGRVLRHLWLGERINENRKTGRVPTTVFIVVCYSIFRGGRRCHE